MRAVVAVGFADMVGFTALSARLDDERLDDLLTRFEDAVDDAVAGGGGRLVKTLGDGAMFTAPAPSQAAAIGLRLAEEARRDPVLPELRVGISAGPVLDRRGDVFGPAVNRASRIADVAPAGYVVVCEDVAAALAGRADLDPLGSPALDGIGTVPLFAVTRLTTVDVLDALARGDLDVEAALALI